MTTTRTRARCGEHGAPLTYSAPGPYRCSSPDAPCAILPRELLAELGEWIDVTDAGNVLVCACDECSDEYGPCEEHGEELAQRAGASSRTADELLAVFVADVRGIREAAGLPVAELDADEARLLAIEGWADTPEDSEQLAELAEHAEQSLPSGVHTYWEDGYRIVRVIGGPLAD